MGSLKICPLRTPICIAKWRSPKRGRWGTLSLRALARSGVRKPGFLRSEALRKGSPKTIIIFRQSLLLLWESTKAVGQAVSKMGLMLWLERVLSIAKSGQCLEVDNEAIQHGRRPHDAFTHFHHHVHHPPSDRKSAWPLLASELSQNALLAPVFAPSTSS